MLLQEIREIESSIRSNQESLLSSFLKQTGFCYSNIFDNCGQKILGEAMFENLKDLVKISKICWTLDREEFKNWIDEAFDELENT